MNPGRRGRGLLIRPGWSRLALPPSLALQHQGVHRLRPARRILDPAGRQQWSLHPRSLPRPSRHRRDGRRTAGPCGVSKKHACPHRLRNPDRRRRSREVSIRQRLQLCAGKDRRAAAVIVEQHGDRVARWSDSCPYQWRCSGRISRRSCALEVWAHRAPVTRSVHDRHVPEYSYSCALRRREKYAPRAFTA